MCDEFDFLFIFNNVIRRIELTLAQNRRAFSDWNKINEIEGAHQHLGQCTVEKNKKKIEEGWHLIAHAERYIDTQ